MIYAITRPDCTVQEKEKKQVSLIKLEKMEAYDEL